MARPCWTARTHAVITVLSVVMVLVGQPAIATGLLGLTLGDSPSGPIVGVVLIVALFLIAAAVAWWLGRSLLVGVSLAVIGVAVTAGSLPLAAVIGSGASTAFGVAGLVVVPLAVALRRGPDGMHDARPDDRARLRGSIAAAAGTGVMALQPLVALEFTWAFSIVGPNPSEGAALALALAHGVVVALVGSVTIVLGRSLLLGIPILAWGVLAASTWVVWFFGAIPAVLVLAILTPIAVARALRPQAPRFVSAGRSFAPEEGTAVRSADQPPDSSSDALTEKVSQELGDPS